MCFLFVGLGGMLIEHLVAAAAAGGCWCGELRLRVNTLLVYVSLRPRSWRPGLGAGSGRSSWSLSCQAAFHFVSVEWDNKHSLHGRRS